MGHGLHEAEAASCIDRDAKLEPIQTSNLAEMQKQSTPVISLLLLHTDILHVILSLDILSGSDWHLFFIV